MSIQPTLPFLDQYEFIEDPGHAWLKVPIAEIIHLKIAEKISTYSYRDADHAYLEEDVDLGIFLHARIGLPMDERRSTPEDTARARKLCSAFCAASVYTTYHDPAFVRQLPPYDASELRKKVR